MTQRTYDAVFFDLDGTLLPMDVDRFMQDYFAALRSFAAEHGFEPDPFLKVLLAATKGMTEPGPGTTNEERFWPLFCDLVGRGRKELETLLNEFYATRFDDLGTSVEPNPSARRAVECLRAKGYPLYLTTMPLFPRVAVESRLGWAGVPVDAFERITTYENSTSVKPYAAYYRENVQAAGVDASRVLMVGNNTREDLAALDLGCDGYLITDFLLDPEDYDVDSVKHGSLAEFAAFVDTLPERG